MVDGKDFAKIIIRNCATKIVFSEKDSEIAGRLSKAFGHKEVKELHEGIAYGAHETHDRVNVSMQNRANSAVLAMSIQALQPNEIYVWLPGNYPVSKVKLKHLNTSVMTQPFLRKN